MNIDQQRLVCIRDELDTSNKLIRTGFGSLQEIDMANDFYHLPHLLIASGLERLMKCYISLVYQGQTGAFPDQTFMKSLGHDLVCLHDKIRNKYYGGATRQLIKKELTYLETDSTLRDCIKILSLFGKFGRYYNLDVVAGSTHSLTDPIDEWKKLECLIEDPNPFINDTESLYRDYYPRVHSKLISKLERLVRAISLQFTVGDHVDQLGYLSQMSSVFTNFRNLKDEELGTIDYRQSVRILKQEEKNWIKRTEHEIVDGQWPTQTVLKEKFQNEWPFRTDRVIVELREQLFAIVNIEGYAFALNGAATSHLNLPCPHAAGMAVLGKSVGSFIEIAWSMNNK